MAQSSQMSDKVKLGKLSDIKPTKRNSNKHTARGMKALDNSMAEDGYVAPMTATADGEIIDGDARLHTAFERFGDEALIIHHDGKKPIVMVRDDIPNSDHPAARRIHYRANLTAWQNLELDPAVVMADIEAGFDFKMIDISLPDLGELLGRAADELLGKGQAGQGEDAEDIDAEDPGDISGLVAPFPYFGGKSRVAGRIWKRFGQVKNYVEPFCGSAAVLLACPFDLSIVTLNDADGFIANFWRAVAYAPDEVAQWVDWPVNENDLFARHVWLIKRSGELVRQLETDPEWYDAKIAGWWCWGACAWLGTGWCSGEGPWSVEEGQVVNVRGDAGQGVNRQLPHLGDAGRGVNRKLPHLGNAGRGVNRQLPHLGDAGQGVNRKLPRLSDGGGGVNAATVGQDFEGDTREAISAHLYDYMHTLADALRRPRVTCGDWQRATTPSVTFRHGLTAVLLDPPYGEGEMEYSGGGNQDKAISAEVWAWALENGDNPELRIAVCGYDDGRAIPPGWTAMRWKARKGYQVSTENSEREMIWFSPHCLQEPVLLG